MKGMTSISIILIIPALIASLYVMNLTNNLQAHLYGLWIVIPVFVFVFVKKKKVALIKPDFNFIFIIVKL